MFVDLYKKRLIYRGKRMVNWCPSSLTALSDATRQDAITGVTPDGKTLVVGSDLKDFWYVIDAQTGTLPNGDVYANAPGGDPSQEWPLSFWMGGWDGDALCAYIRGTWQIPLK